MSNPRSTPAMRATAAAIVAMAIAAAVFLVSSGAPERSAATSALVQIAPFIQE